MGFDQFRAATNSKGQCQPFSHLVIAAPGTSVASLADQALQSDGTLPARQRVVADMDHPARPYPGFQQTDDAGLHAWCNPTPHPMQADKIGVRDLGKRRFIGERR